MGAVPVTIRVETDDPTPVPIDGILVQTYTDPGDVFYTSGITGVTGPGEIELTMDGDGVGIGYLVRLSLLGHSFAGQPFSISVLDPPAPVNEFTYQAQVGPTAVLVKLLVKDSNDDPVDGVRVRIYDDSDTYATESLTGGLVPGEVEFPLVGAPDPGQQYIARLRPPTGYEVLGGSTKILQVLDPLVAPATNIFDFVIAPKAAMGSPDPLMCRLSGYFVDSAKRPLKNVELTFQAIEGYPNVTVSGFPYSGQPTVIGGLIMGSPYTKAKTDKNGFVSIDLPRTAIFNVHISGLETPGVQIVEQIYIPDLAGIPLQDVLFPYVTGVTYEEDPINVVVGQSVVVGFDIATSNLQVISETKDLACLVEFSTDDDSIAAVKANKEGQLVVEGLAVGSTTVEVERVVGTFAPRLPPIPDLVVTPSTIIVGAAP